MIHDDRFDDLPAWRIDLPHGQAHVSAHGGQLLSWRPQDGEDVFWCSPITRRPPQAIRGGVPICWPYFGRQGQPPDAVQHGHARISPWQFIDARADGDDVVIDLALPPHAHTPLRLRQRLRFGADTLVQTLVSENPSDAAVTLTQALHSYFAVGDVRGVRLDGLEGCLYEDKIRGGRHRQDAPWRLEAIEGDAACDRIYATTTPRFVLRDPVRSRRLVLETRGSRSLVLWNPRAAGAAIPDLPAQGWQGFLCVETANAGDDVITLQPGGEHRLSQRVTVAPLD